MLPWYKIKPCFLVVAQYADLFIIHTLLDVVLFGIFWRELLDLGCLHLCESFYPISCAFEAYLERPLCVVRRVLA